MGEPDGSHLVRAEIRGPRDQAESLGRQLGEQLLANGAADILKRLYHQG